MNRLIAASTTAVRCFSGLRAVSATQSLPLLQQLRQAHLYTQSHEWVSVEGDIATIGITNYAQEALGDIVYVQLPTDLDETLDSGDEIAAVESVKAASEVYAPIDGTLVEVNERLDDEPQLVNSSPEGDGWMVKMRMGNPDQLSSFMSEADYKSFLETSSD
eukprot:m.131875 g.131875  ORF g.131875 m.131875 type:complete len:161 (+) comp15916_c0_seq2:1240-1722(+)